MATWEDVRRIVADLPETSERTSGRGALEWRVRGKLVVWERPLRGPDLDALGTAAPDGPTLAARVPDLVAKGALLADDSGVYLTTPHFDDHPIVLVRLDRIDPQELEELVIEAWLDQAPRKVAAAYLASHP